MKHPNDEHPQGALLVPPHSRWRHDALQPPQMQRATLDRNACVHVPDDGFRCVTWNTRGLIEYVTSSQISRDKHYFSRLIETTTSFASKKYMGGNWSTDFGCMVHLYQATKMQKARPHCINKDLLPDDTVVTHVVTCQGRDHIVSIRSGRRSLVVVNVHFEPELTLRSLRERLRLITPHLPQYPNAIGMIMSDFVFCEPEEGMFNVWDQNFTDGDMQKVALFHFFFSPRS